MWVPCPRVDMRGPYPIRSVHASVEPRVLVTVPSQRVALAPCTAHAGPCPAGIPPLRCASLPCHGHCPLPHSGLDLASVLYLTSQALDSMPDLPAGSPPHMLHGTAAQASPHTRDGAWDPCPLPLAWKKVTGSGSRAVVLEWTETEHWGPATCFCHLNCALT